MSGNIWDFSQTMQAADEANLRDKQFANQSTLQNLQMDQLRQKMKEDQGLQDFRAGWSPYLQANRSLLEPTQTTTQQPMNDQEIQSSIGTGVGPIVSKDVTTTMPAKENYQSLYGKYALEKGQPEIGIKMMDEGRKMQQDQLKDALAVLEPIRKLASTNKKAAQSLVDSVKKTFPLLKDWEFNTDEKTGYDTITVPSKDGSGTIIGHTIITIDQNGEKVGNPHFEPVKADKETGAQADEQYRKITTQLKLDPSIVSPEAKAWAQSYEKQKTLSAQTFGSFRMQAIMDIPVSAYDVNTGGVGFVTRKEIQENPGRYVGGELATKLKSKASAFDEIQISSQQVRDALAKLPGDFSQKQVAKFASVLQVKDDGGTIRNFLKSDVAKTLTQPEIEYVTAVKNLRESSFALRSLQGMGQGSDMLREAIASVVPGPTTPNKAYAFSSLDRFDTQVKTLKQAIPGLGGVSNAGQGGGKNASNYTPPQVVPPTVGKFKIVKVE
jgi:hypothetical protein